MTSPWGRVSDTPIQEETPVQTVDTLERLHLTAGWERLGVPLEEFLEVTAEGNVSLIRL